MSARLLTVFSLLHITSALSSYTISLAVDSMTLHKSQINNECPSGTISGIQINIGYRYADKARCDFTESHMYPVEDTPIVRKLLNYSGTSSQKFSECLTDENCDSVDFSEWKNLTRRLYRACFYCYKTRDGTCEEQTVTNYRDNTALYPIINTMFLYALINCSVTSSGFVTIPIQYRTRDQPYLTNVTEKLACPPDHSPKILSVTQQADNLRVHMSENPEPSLTEILTNSLQTKNLQTLDINAESLSVFGGYWWGKSFRGRTLPTDLLVALECEPVILESPEFFNDHRDHDTIRVSAARDNRAMTQTDSEEQANILIIVFSCLAALLIATIAIVLIVILTRRERTNNIEQNSTKAEPNDVSHVEHKDVLDIGTTDLQSV